MSVSFIVAMRLFNDILKVPPSVGCFLDVGTLGLDGEPGDAGGQLGEKAEGERICPLLKALESSSTLVLPLTDILEGGERTDCEGVLIGCVGVETMLGGVVGVRSAVQTSFTNGFWDSLSKFLCSSGTTSLFFSKNPSTS